MNMLAKRTSLMKPSAILALAAKANDLKASGKNVISLTVGEPDWQTYDNVKEAGIKSIRDGQIKYTPSSGIADLRKAVAEQVSKDIGVSYTAAEVTVSSGAKFVLFAALQSLMDAGDECILLAPFWASYSTMVELAEGTPRVVVCDAKTNFKVTPAQLRAAITPKTKVILFNSPSNPTGEIYTRDELKALAEVLREFPRVVVISDDIYNRLVFTGEALAPHLLQVAPDFKSRCILLNGASKSYAMTGWRLGWALGPKAVIDAMSNYQSQSVSCASGVSQYAALEAVKNCDPMVAQTVKTLQARREFWLGELKRVPGLKAHPPAGAFYIWVDVSHFIGKKFKGQTMTTTTEISAALLEDQLVAVVPGIEFGLDGFLRISFAIENSKAKEAVDRMQAFFASIA